jgi:hypothetical protein
MINLVFVLMQSQWVGESQATADAGHSPRVVIISLTSTSGLASALLFAGTDISQQACQAFIAFH